MAKNVIIFHGTDCRPNDFWYPWLKGELEESGYQVRVPYYEDINKIPIDEFLAKIGDDIELNDETILVGHSAGGPLILSLLERTSVQVAKAVVVAGFSEPLNGGKPDTILQESYDWQKIKSHAKEFVFINSDNDPWGCDDKQGMKMQASLGGKLIVLHDGHFGSTSNNQPYKEFPQLLQLIKE